jgi:nickel-dependent lactate racemase
MRITMNYGKKGLTLDLPDDIEATVIRKRQMPLQEDPHSAVNAALASPVGCGTLSEEAKNCDSICILICDITRPVPNGLVLPPVIQQLMKVGIAPESITVLVATGLHRPNEGETLREVVGSDWVLQTLKVVNHFAKNDADHVYVGTTPRGIPLRFDKRFVNSDLRIAIGLVDPHFMAGYSGGRKVVLPGVAHRDTIRAFHSTQILTHNSVRNCVLEGNPVHEEQLLAMRMLGRSLAINIILDEHRNLTFVNYGEIEASHFAAVSLGRPYFEIPVKQKFKTVITSAAGYPLDTTYYQTVKGMVGVIDVLEPGGDVFIVSECSEGLGTKEYAQSQAKLIDAGIEEFLAETSLRQYAAIDEWQSVMQAKAMKVAKIHLYSECLTPEEKALTGVNIVESLEDTVEQCITKKQDNRMAIIPEGPYVIPRCNT